MPNTQLLTYKYKRQMANGRQQKIWGGGVAVSRADKLDPDKLNPSKI